MSRDQKPGKVRHVGAVQERRHANAAPQPGAAATGTGGPVAAGVSAGAGVAGAKAAAPVARSRIGGIAIVLFLVFAAVGGGGLVALAPMLGLWP